MDQQVSANQNHYFILCLSERSHQRQCGAAINRKRIQKSICSEGWLERLGSGKIPCRTKRQEVIMQTPVFRIAIPAFFFTFAVVDISRQQLHFLQDNTGQSWWNAYCMPSEGTPSGGDGCDALCNTIPGWQWMMLVETILSMYWSHPGRVFMRQQYLSMLRCVLTKLSWNHS